MIYKFTKYDGNKYSFGLTNNNRYNSNYISLRPVFKWKNEKYKFLKGLEILIAQGIDVFTAIQVLKDSNEYKKERKTIEQIYKHMSNGESFYSSLKKSTDLPDYYLTLIKVAELTDDLLEPLSEANKMRDRNTHIKRKLEGAISYPIFLALISIIMLIIMSNVVLPMFQSLFDSFETELPLITKITISMGKFFTDNLVGIVIFFFVLSVLLVLLKAVSVGYYIFVEKYKFRYSILKKIRQDRFHEMFFKKFYILYSRLENTSEVIKHIALSEDNIFLRINLLKLNKGIKMGKNFVDIASESNVFNEFSTALFTGVSITESMKTVSKNLSIHYERSLDNRIEVLTRWASPIATIIVGGIIGLMALGLILPVFSLSSVI